MGRIFNLLPRATASLIIEMWYPSDVALCFSLSLSLSLSHRTSSTSHVEFVVPMGTSLPLLRAHDFELRLNTDNERRLPFSTITRRVTGGSDTITSAIRERDIHKDANSSRKFYTTFWCSGMRKSNFTWLGVNTEIVDVILFCFLFIRSFYTIIGKGRGSKIGNNWLLEYWKIELEKEATINFFGKCEFYKSGLIYGRSGVDRG